MKYYYLNRSAPQQRYTLSRCTLKDGENLGPYQDYATAKTEMARINAEIPPRKRPAKPPPPAPAHKPKFLLTRQEFGEAVYQIIKDEIESRGFRLWVENFDPDYPLSLRQIGYIRKGRFNFETLRRLPGLKVDEWFTV